MNSMIRRCSLKPEETVAYAKRILDSNLRHYDGLRMRWITVLENDERGRNALCLIKAVPKGRRPAAEEGRKYKYVHLLEAWLEPAQLLAILEQGGACPLDFAGEPTPFNPQAQFSEIELLPSSNDYSPYPGYLFQSRGGGCFTITAEPLLSYSLPFAPTPFAAMSDWCECLRPISSGDGRIGEILIFLPDCRAYISGLAIEGNEMTVSLTLTDPAISDLRMKGNFQHGEAGTPFDISVAEAKFTLPVPPETNSFEAYLIGPDDTLYDFHRETPFWTIGQERALLALHPKTSVEEVVNKAIRLGEGEMIEFKPYITPRSEKENELITTAIAFSNTKGGAILIGVDNHCLIKGIEKDLRKASRHHEQGIEQALQEYIGSVRQTIGGGVTRTMVLEISQLEIQGHRVVVVQVPEGTEKPYANVLTKAIHIRRGANNVIPDPDTELPQLLTRYLVENMPLAPSQIHRI